MNATPVVSLAPSTPDLTQTGGGAAADSAKPAGNGQDFAAALSDVGAKSARKPSPGKSHDGGDVGGQLPATGNDSPPPAKAAPPPAQTSAAAMNAAAAEAAASKAALSASALNSATAAANSAAAATGAAAASAAAAGAAAAASSAAAAMVAGSADAGRQTDVSGAAAIAAAQAQGAGGTLGPADGASGSAAAANTGTAFAQSLSSAAPAGAQGGTNAQPTDQSALPPSIAQAIRNVGAGHVPDSVRASAASRSPNGSAAGGKVQSAGRGTTAANGGDEVSDADDGTAPPVSPAPSAGAQAAPSAAAVAMSAAANGTAAAGVAAAAEPSSSPADDSTTPVEGVNEQAAGIAGLTPPALVAPPVLAAAAAKAAANTQALTALANAAAADKHARGGSDDSLTSTATSTTAGAVAGSTPSGSSGSADAVPVPTLKVAAGVDTAEFGQGVADRVSYMVDNNLSGAKLQINPPQLGPIEVRIAVQGDHAQVWLTSHSAVTRDALESSSPKLREMLGSQGFGQVSVDISQRSFQERPSQAQNYDWTPAADRGASAAPASTTATPLSRISSGAVDAYA